MIMADRTLQKTLLRCSTLEFEAFDLSDPPMTYISKATPFKVFFVPELHNVSTLSCTFAYAYCKEAGCGH